MSGFENPLAADGWVEKFDQAKSKPYYVNTQTKVTQWDRPDALGGASNGAVMDDGMDDGDDIDNMIAKQQPQKANTPHVCNAHTAPWEKRIVRLGQRKMFIEHLAGARKAFDVETVAGGWTTLTMYDRTTFRTTRVIAEHVVDYSNYYGGGIVNGGGAMILKFLPRIFYFLGWDTWDNKDKETAMMERRWWSKCFLLLVQCLELYYFCAWVQTKKLYMWIYVALYLYIRRYILKVRVARGHMLDPETQKDGTQDITLFRKIDMILFLAVLVLLFLRGFFIWMDGFYLEGQRACIGQGTNGTARMPFSFPMRDTMPFTGTPVLNPDFVCQKHVEYDCSWFEGAFFYDECGWPDKILMYITIIVWVVTGFLHKKWLYLNTKFDYEWELDNTNWDDMQIMTLDLEVLQTSQLLIGRTDTKRIKIRVSLDVVKRFDAAMVKTRPKQLEVLAKFGTTLPHMGHMMGDKGFLSGVMGGSASNMWTLGKLFIGFLVVLAFYDPVSKQMVAFWNDLVPQTYAALVKPVFEWFIKAITSAKTTVTTGVGGVTG